MYLEKLQKKRLYAAVFNTSQLQRWDPLYTDEIIAAQECEGVNEYERLWAIWTSPKYLFNYFNEKKIYITNGYYGTIPLIEACEMTDSYIDHFFDQLDNDNLDDLFKTLQNSPMSSADNRYKYKIKETVTEKNWLRIYAIRVEPGVYVITGGAIKLWKNMDMDDVTVNELKKIDLVKDFLIRENIVDADSLEACVMEQSF